MTDSSVKLQYSNDTVFFDTIFTDTGSQTKELLIYNNNDGSIKIDKLFIDVTLNNRYFLNVNGVSGTEFNDIILEKNDSIYVFIQTKLAENGVDTMLKHTDAIVIEYNNNADLVNVLSWGQDVTKLIGKSVNTETWNSVKPYYIFDSLVINEGETLTLEAGVRLFFTFNSNLIVKGNLVVNGTRENPVYFLPDRMEHRRSTYPGNWGSIQIKETSTNNHFSWAVIKNAIHGLYVSKSQHRINITLENTKIENMFYTGIYAPNCSVYATNCLFSNCAQYIIAAMGGKHSYIHCTIGNVINVTGNLRFTPSVLVSDYYVANNEQIETDSVTFLNCIIVGDYSTEIKFDKKFSEDLPWQAKYSLLKWNDKDGAFDSNKYLNNCFQYDSDSSLFVNGKINDFQLDTLSQAINKAGLIDNSVSEFDLNGKSRKIDSKPDCGAYEYFYSPPVLKPTE
ncbi:MAG: hypothetical protein IPO21_00205 [Bacteroidales bacterium]|nr:hypothetical protein [Bacteroidales bacterium]